LVWAALYGEISGLIRAGLEHVQLAVLDFSSSAGGPCRCDFLDVWPHSASTSCLMCKYGSSINSARRGPLSFSSTARQRPALVAPVSGIASTGLGYPLRFVGSSTQLHLIPRPDLESRIPSTRPTDWASRHCPSYSTRPPFSGGPCASCDLPWWPL
jgi:hypothetical protein